MIDEKGKVTASINIVRTPARTTPQELAERSIGDLSDDEGVVASGLSVIGSAIDISGDQLGILIRYEGALETKLHLLSRRLLGDPKALMSELESKGIKVEPNVDGSRILQAVKDSVRKQYLIVEREGYFKVRFRGGFAEFYVIGRKHFGTLPPQINGAILDPSLTSTYSRAGSLEDWKLNVGTLCQDNPLLITALAAAMSIVFSALLNRPTLSFGIFGASGTGTEGISHVVHSLTGGLARQTFEGDSRVIGALIRAAGHRPVTMNEVGDSSAVTKALSMICAPGGQATQPQSSMWGDPEIGASASVLVCTGDVDLAELLSARGQLRGGHLVRMLSFSSSYEHGCYAQLHSQLDSNEFSERLSAVCKQFCGRLWREFIAAAFKDPEKTRSNVNQLFAPTKAYLRSRIRSTLPTAIFNSCVDSAALWLLAGDFAAVKELVPWSRHESRAAIVECLQKWADENERESPVEIEILSKMREYLAQNQDAFSPCDGGEFPANPPRSGFLETRGDTSYFLFHPEVFRKLFGSTAAIAVDTLKRLGFLLAPTVGGMKEKRFKKTKFYFYFVSSKILQ
jgi:hypothetical protein